MQPGNRVLCLYLHQSLGSHSHVIIHGVHNNVRVQSSILVESLWMSWDKVYVKIWWAGWDSYSAMRKRRGQVGSKERLFQKLFRKREGFESPFERRKPSISGHVFTHTNKSATGDTRGGARWASPMSYSHLIFAAVGGALAFWPQRFWSVSLQAVPLFTEILRGHHRLESLRSQCRQVTCLFPFALSGSRKSLFSEKEWVSWYQRQVLTKVKWVKTLTVLSPVFRAASHIC